MKACKHCGSDQHASLMCFQRPRKPLQSKRKLLNRVGPVTARWIETRHQWIAAHVTATGTWNCYLCGRELTLDTLTLDHIKSRSRHPELRFDLTNLAPCCIGCNTRKGSKDLEELYAQESSEF